MSTGTGRMSDVVLASASPRRAELLRRVGLDVDVRPADVDESVLPGESAADYVLRVAHDKARAVSSLLPDERLPVLAADTSVVLDAGDSDEVILGKPVDGGDALTTLASLSGRAHHVLTSVVVIDRAGIEHAALARAVVRFASTTEDQRRWYVGTGEPMDCAGSYALQGIGAFMVERVDGDPTTVIGLPLGVALDLLVTAGLRWPSNPAAPPD